MTERQRQLAALAAARRSAESLEEAGRFAARAGGADLARSIRAALALAEQRAGELASVLAKTRGN